MAIAGISPMWGFVPVGFVFLYGLLRANYENWRGMAMTAEQLTSVAYTIYVLHGVEEIESVHATFEGARRAAAARGITDDREWFLALGEPQWFVGPGLGPAMRITAHKVQCDDR